MPGCDRREIHSETDDSAAARTLRPFVFGDDVIVVVVSPEAGDA